MSMICRVRLDIYESVETVDGMTFRALPIPILVDMAQTPFLCSVKMWHLNHGINALMPLIPVNPEQFNFVTLDAVRKHTQTQLFPPDDDDTSVAPSVLSEDSSSSTADDGCTVNDALSQDETIDGEDTSCHADNIGEMIEGEDTSCQADNINVDMEDDPADHLVNANCHTDNIDTEIEDLEDDLADHLDNARCPTVNLVAVVEEALAVHHDNNLNQLWAIDPTWVHVMMYPLEDGQYQLSMVIIDSSPTQYCLYP